MTTASTASPPSGVSVKVRPVTESGSSGWSKTAETPASGATCAAPPAGVVLVTRGAAGAAPATVNAHVRAGSAPPSAARTPSRRAVYVAGSRLESGCSVAVREAGS